MHIVAHRRNTIDELRATPPRFGVEVDIRSQGPDLVVHHDPYTQGVPFEDWLEAFRHGLLILNVKEEGLEKRLTGLMEAKGHETYFFLDQSFPFLIRTAMAGERRCAVRVSEYESVETALTLGGLIDWVWVDCFTRWPLNAKDAERLRETGLRLCAVSPELQGRTEDSAVTDLQSLLAREGIALDAVCTKKTALWEEWRP